MTARTKWIGALAALVIAAVAFTGGVFTGKPSTPGNDSPEAGFARDMSIHHAQAVGMAMIEVQVPLLTDTPADAEVAQEIKTLAYDIATNQQNQIGQMSAWLQSWNLLPTGDQPRMAWMGASDELQNGLMPGMATTDQVNELTQAKGEPADVLFLQLMLRHHLGGIHMVEGILSVTHNDQVRTLAHAMKDGQQREVTIMQSLLAKLGAQPL
jgi:uncharacterized protein (DUF305 family)